eukprot:TRINITY_DN14893_c0_g1_i3.p2 TRINITY_DN14893_c0_g1~~TRINITY_DN14893_c0_g1_i3.p2  ORF type:complete len:328 (-),score=70.38 TRINITY_DN14893_c0_g1_i3:286-1269(-)
MSVDNAATVAPATAEMEEIEKADPPAQHATAASETTTAAVASIDAVAVLAAPAASSSAPASETQAALTTGKTGEAELGVPTPQQPSCKVPEQIENRVPAASGLQETPAESGGLPDLKDAPLTNLHLNMPAADAPPPSSKPPGRGRGRGRGRSKQQLSDEAAGPTKSVCKEGDLGRAGGRGRGRGRRSAAKPAEHGGRKRRSPGQAEPEDATESLDKPASRRLDASELRRLTSAKKARSQLATGPRPGTEGGQKRPPIPKASKKAKTLKTLKALQEILTEMLAHEQELARKLAERRERETPATKGLLAEPATAAVVKREHKDEVTFDL